MVNAKSQKFAAYFTKEIFLSPAYRSLRPSAKEILLLVYFKVNFTKGKKGRRILANRKDIKLPYREITESLGYQTKAIWDAFKQLLAHGFIEVIEHGGGAKGDVNTYGITEDWRKWKTGEVVREIVKNGKIGFQKEIYKKKSEKEKLSCGKSMPAENEKKGAARTPVYERISSIEGKEDCSPVGNQLSLKKERSFPDGRQHIA